jgi:ureidoacrylate peracid hydrolase
MICGVVTNLCVETTVRSAFMRDIPVTLIEDACAAKTRRLHELSIEVLTSYELAEIVRVGDGFDAGEPQRSNYLTDWRGQEELAGNSITGG